MNRRKHGDCVRRCVGPRWYGRGSLFLGRFASIGSVLLGAAVAEAQTALPGHLPTGPDCHVEGMSQFVEIDGLWNSAVGADIDLSNLDDNDRPEIILAQLNRMPGMPSGFQFRYKIGWDYQLTTGNAQRWTSVVLNFHARMADGVGVAAVDIDASGVRDILLMVHHHDPASETYIFSYKIGYDVQEIDGQPLRWSDLVSVPGFGEADGASLTVSDIDANGIADMLLLVYTKQPRGFRYKIGWNLDAAGNATNWDELPSAPAVGGGADGAGVATGDIDGDGAQDLVLMAYDSTTQYNGFRYRVGWRLQTNGVPWRWSRTFVINGVGTDGDGAGVAFVTRKIWLAGMPRFWLLNNLLFMGYDDPDPSVTPENSFRIVTLALTTAGATFGVAGDLPGVVDNNLSVPTSPATQTGDRLFNLNMMDVRRTANDAFSLFVAHCCDPANTNDPSCWYWYPYGHHSYGDVAVHFKDYLRDAYPDLLAAAVAWYVHGHMGYVRDTVNAYVLNEIFQLNYAFGAEGVPAFYTIHFTDPTTQPNLLSDLAAHDPSWAADYNDGKRFHGDCEDFAILRHALLRALGFDRRFVWNAFSPGHEFNIVLYRGTYRIMDFGPIHSGFACSSLSCINRSIKAAWNQTYGPRLSSEAGAYFHKYVLERIAPDNCSVHWGHLFTSECHSDWTRCGR